MKRRDFFKSAAVVGIASILKPGTLAAGTAASNSVSVQATTDMVAVMGGEPEIMLIRACLLYTSPSPRDRQKSRMPSSA